VPRGTWRSTEENVDKTYKALQLALRGLIAQGADIDELWVIAREVLDDYRKYGEDAALIAREDYLNDV
jgi:hypothetical protein